MVAGRPSNFGATGKIQPLDGNDELALRIISDSSGNPIYYGRAETGTFDNVAKWQLRKLAYDVNGNITSQKWPRDEKGFVTSKFIFKWDSGTSATITGATQANPIVVTTTPAHGLSDGDVINITGVVGMTELNFTGNNFYKVANSTATTMELTDENDVDINSTAYGAYTSGGTISRPNYANNIYG
jgi:hypothetical protein